MKEPRVVMPFMKGDQPLKGDFRPKPIPSDDPPPEIAREIDETLAGDAHPTSAPPKKMGSSMTAMEANALLETLQGDVPTNETDSESEMPSQSSFLAMRTGVGSIKQPARALPQETSMTQILSSLDAESNLSEEVSVASAPSPPSVPDTQK